MEPCEWDSIYKIRVLRVFVSPSDTVFHSVSLLSSRSCLCWEAGDATIKLSVLGAGCAGCLSMLFFRRRDCGISDVFGLNKITRFLLACNEDHGNVLK